VKKLSPPGVALGVWAKSPISSDERLRRKERINVAATPQGAHKVIDITGGETLQNKLAALSKVTSDTAPILTEIGEYIQTIAKLSLRSGIDVYGAKFAALSKKTKRAKKSPVQILVDSGALSRVTYTLGKNSVQIGTNAHSAKTYPYPVVHQFGDKKGNLPKRAFFPVELAGGEVVLTKDAQKEVEGIVEKGVLEAVRSS